MEQQESPFLRKALMSFSYLMVLVFLGLGILILVTGYPKEMPVSTKNGLAVILLVYGSFRAYRVYQEFKKS